MMFLLFKHKHNNTLKLKELVKDECSFLYNNHLKSIFIKLVDNKSLDIKILFKFIKN